jgi:MFS family permease
MVYTIIIFAALLNGFGGSMLWIGQGKYFADCAPESKKGLYFSIFWFFFQSNMIFGNIMSAFILGEDN